MKERAIQSQECINEGASFLANIEPRFKYALEVTGELPLRLSPEGFERLLGAIISQQVSVAAANSIWKRLVKANLNGPRKIMRADDAELRAVGLSRQKVRYARALAESKINFRSLRSMSSEEVINTLTQVSGIGCGLQRFILCLAWLEPMYLRPVISHCRSLRAYYLNCVRDLQKGKLDKWQKNGRPGELLLHAYFGLITHIQRSGKA